MNPTNVEGFTDALRKIFGISNVVMHDGGDKNAKSHGAVSAQTGARRKRISASTVLNKSGNATAVFLIRRRTIFKYKNSKVVFVKHFHHLSRYI
jgi:hypothetical protein